MEQRAHHDLTPIADESGPSVSSLGESEVLRRILAELSFADAATVGPGDDCAVIEVDHGEIVVTSDTMIEGPDFRTDWHSGFELGWKLAATNLSDVAAMGAAPTALTVSLACPPDTPVRVLEQIAAGLDAACRALAPGCGVVGGDLARAPVIMAAVTAIGEAKSTPVLRSGARAGDVVAYAGQLGLSGLGFARLRAGSAGEVAVGSAAGGEGRAAAVRAHLAPEPPIHLGTAAAHATAMMDVSDGLALDTNRLARASGVIVHLDSRLLSRHFGERQGERVPLETMLTGGEDHGLLATFAPDAEMPEGFHVIGETLPVFNAGDAEPDAAARVLLDGEPIAALGWDPFTAG